MILDWVDVGYHQQDTLTLCGPASVQMVLGSINCGLPDQGYLNGLVSSNGEADGMSPARLRATLNAAKGTYPETFVACYDGTHKAALRRIVETLRLRQTAVPTVVWGNHWVVVTAAVLSGAATPDRPNKLRGFFINNPMPVTPTTPQEGFNCSLASPHTSSDCCGHGYVFGSANTYVTLDAWIRHYWRAFYVDIEANEPPGFVTVIPEAKPPRRQIRRTRGTLVVEPPARLPIKTIDQSTAQRAAEVGIAAHGLSCLGPLRKALRGATAFSACLQTDPFAGSCYRVGLRDAQHNLVAYAFVDGASSEFFGAQAPPSGTPIPIDIAFVVAALTSHQDELRDVLSPAAIENRDFKVDDTLVWVPSAESMSPYHPFIVVDTGAAMLFIASNGAVYRQLHPHP